MSRARIIDEPAKVYAEMDLNQPPRWTLPIGEVVELAKIKRRHGKTWVTITRQDGSTGFITGETHVFQMRHVELNKPTDLYAEASAESRVIHQYKKNDRVVMQDVVREGNSGWVLVQDIAGRKGYIPGKVRIRVIPDDLVAAGKKNMIMGGIWAAGGILLTVIVSLTSAEMSATTMIAWGAAIFGVLQIIQGIMQYFSGRKDQKDPK